MFGQRQRIRRTAVHMLLVWLFALAAGIVNACVLEPASRHGDAGSATHEPHDAGAARHHGGTHAASVHDHQSPHASKAPCVKFCDEPSTGAQALKQQFDPFTTASLAPPPANPPIVDTTTRLRGEHAADHRLWRPVIPTTAVPQEPVTRA